jgi:hypothetical protein
MLTTSMTATTTAILTFYIGTIFGTNLGFLIAAMLRVSANCDREIYRSIERMKRARLEDGDRPIVTKLPIR